MLFKGNANSLHSYQTAYTVSSGFEVIFHTLLVY